MVDIAQPLQHFKANIVKMLEAQWLIWIVVLLALTLRLWRLDSPQQVYFDEVYHVPAAQLMSQGDWSAFEWWHPPVDGSNYFDWLHPPLAKYTQAISIWFGRTVFHSISSVWWRLPSALFGVGTVWLVMLIVEQVSGQMTLAHNLDMNRQRKSTLFAMFFAGIVAATDGLLLVQSRIAMNDSLLGFLLVLVGWLVVQAKVLHSSSVRTIWLTAVVVGMAMATKWTGVFVWLVLVGWLSVALIGYVLAHEYKYVKLMIARLLLMVVLPWVVYLLLYAPAALSHQGYGYVVALHQQAWLYHLNRDSNHAYASKPQQWVVNMRPVWYWQDTSLVSTNREQSNNVWRANIYAVSHPLLPVIGLVAVGWAVLTLVFFKRKNTLFWQIFFVCSMYGVVWLPWFLSPRILFYYHYLPAIPFLAILIGGWLRSILSRGSSKIWRYVIILIYIWIFIAILWLPHWLGLRVPKELVDTIYFGLPGWR